MSTRMGALAAQYVGRTVILETGQRATITRVTRRGLTVRTSGGDTRSGLMAADIARWED